MYNAAIIVFRRSTLPKILRAFAKPGIIRVIEAGSTEMKTRVYMIECPVLKRPENNRKAAKSLLRLCMENNIRFFIGENTEYYFGSGLEHIESSVERGSIDEIAAIKGLAALIKLSVEQDVNLLKKNMCFLGMSHSYRYISTMSEEASAVFIYEHDKMDNAYKKAVFERLMAEKGISAAFTRDLDRAISQCDIILADDSIDLTAYKMSLSGKTIIGNNSAVGNFKKISQVRLWYDSMAGMAEENAFIRFNDEMLGILRHFYKEKGPIDFIRKFPYISMS